MSASQQVEPLRGRQSPREATCPRIASGFPRRTQYARRQPHLLRTMLPRAALWRARFPLGRLSQTLVFVLCALIACPGRVAADAGAGKNKAEACAACHGENGISQIENTPSLAAEPDQFLQWQLVFFRSGAQERGHGADRRRSS